ncbi:SDR family oxidoreductase [Craterilacuibacter sp. RT1T]|uniref:SDR family oxidoreductase n=1 Tax=Craterilacuibacter sp. RT1T TaxID=2942211 RepID=UPI0020BEFFA7|nr:SDR family oxidoreductase [Craterilacuibacter sp. RT1T]MCL6263284.1 SDR family oxidoreductase [Craterilacuibacter sp. RT1T]
MSEIGQSGRVAGKIALITGAASGVGREDALLFAAQGARVVLTDVNVDAGNALAREIGEAALFLPHDIADAHSWNRVMDKTLSHFGALDILVNNAAICPPASIEDCTLDAWQKVMRVNADGYFLGCQAGVAAMKEKGGAIINMSSVAALGGMDTFVAYSASKGAVAALTRSVAVHCRKQRYRIRCNSVHPDGILTPLTADLYPKGVDMSKFTIDHDPLARMCLPRDVANVVLFLASDEARAISGSEVRVDSAQLVMSL